jgi:putative nucleotidyltransferase with HDIG domain
MKIRKMSESLSEYHNLVESLAGELPSIPLIMNDLLKIISDSNAALFAIRDMIKNDKTIFSKVLKFANNVEYRQGSAERITSISDAIQRLGLENVKKIALNTSVFKLFEELESNSQFKLEDLWMHSCGVAIASEVLAERFESKFSEHAYSCGLLHDLGKVAKLKFSSENFFKEVQHAFDNDQSFHSAELNFRSLQHDVLGALLVQKWGISPVVEDTTRWHHTVKKSHRTGVEDPNMHKLIDLVKLANHIIKDIEFGNSGYRVKLNLDPEFLRRRKMDDQELQNCKEVVQEALEAEAEHLAIFSKE